ncbi:Pimeloyl-ACP methyl ester carboxylesterase [Parasphingorhabdus marina DSM 22363]|uniref:Pimeloyl-ACP methyl ester carboxylesterase n=1 Tax=Parasphingorhabdus marina DSM 22363 TaxID=1123272 RepID=A0A1N6G4K8_9SPHN|nr:alpha/beta fold hydrolase [Parasphingorhabdus marina]SIO02391.1 Pimeloyl-ACP methyl ester carboxylesterase [Parasphingorhabdus marina DSM 22363]
MTTLLYIILALIAAMLIVYFAFPKALYGGLRNMLRRRGGLVEKSITVGDHVWPFLEGRPAEGVPVVLLHGFGGDKDNWSVYAAHITGTHRLIAPDLPGFGENDRSLDRDYDIASQCHRLVAFLDAMGITKCHLGGNSMGGFIALQFALEYPDMVASLTLFNNAGVVGEDKSELQIAAEDGKNVLALTSVEDTTRLMKFVAYKPVAMPGQFRKLFFEEANAHKELLDKIFWQIAGSGLNDPLNDRLGDVKAPTLIIWGRHDRLIDVSCVKVLADGIENSESVIFEKTGHIPMIEKPKESASVHLAFLAKQ